MNWLPHITLAKKLSSEDMLIAFRILQKNFAPIEAKVISIGLASVNPHKDLWTYHG